MRVLVFTDLDGTLLNHADYGWEEAKPALERLTALEIPVILVTSKTRAEVEVLQRQMALEEPFVVENGGGIFIPGRYVDLAVPGSTLVSPYRLLVLGCGYSEIRSFVEQHRDRFSIEGFGDMAVERIVALTGLTRKQARLAARREFTEPFLLRDEGRLPALRKAALDAGLAITTGGRFHHLMGEQQDKGRAVRVVTEIFQHHWHEAVETIGLGDSPNDYPMLESVDHPVVIPGASDHLAGLFGDRATLARWPGSRGWSESLLRIIEKLYS